MNQKPPISKWKAKAAIPPQQIIATLLKTSWKTRAMKSLKKHKRLPMPLMAMKRPDWRQQNKPAVTRRENS